MAALGRHWRIQLLMLVGLVLLGGLIGPPSRAEVRVLREAQAELVTPSGTQSRTVTLPYLWEREQGAVPGRSVFTLGFVLEPVPTEPWALSLPRAANGYEVRLNGVVLDRFGDLTRSGESDAKLPRLVRVPADVLQPHNDLRIALRSDVGRQSGLGAVTLGPAAQVEALHQPLWLWRVFGRQMVAVFSALIGLIGLVLWLTQGERLPDGRFRRDAVYLYGGLAEVFWTFRVSDSLIESPPLSLPWWSVMSSVALGAWGCLTMLFCLRVMGWGSAPGLRRLQQWLSLLAAAGFPAGAAGWVYARPQALTLWYGLLGLTFLVFALAILRAALRRAADLNTRLLAFAVLFNVLTGLTDLYRLRVQPSTDGSTSLYFSSVLFGLAAGFIVLMRFRAASEQARNLTRNLTEIVRQREQELRRSYDRLAELARDQATAAERSRILRDMHDGVGAHISTAIRQLQSGRATAPEVLQTLRDSLDQLKLSIDAMHLPAGDVTALLANVRYRLEPRLKACNLHLEWAVQEIEPLASLDAAAMRQLQFMVFEVISNVLQHAAARRLRIQAAATPQGVAIDIEDDGVGFDTGAGGGRGLSTLHQRAQAIGAELRIDSRPGAGTRLGLWLPCG
ncbi:MAG: histidine kinase [Rhodoferax sp.]|nr:histidine kinase [Rhodoferax sp.]